MRRKGSVCSSEPFGTLRVKDGSESILSIECGVASRPPSNAGSLDGVVFVIVFSGGASLERRAMGMGHGCRARSFSRLTSIH